MIQIFHKLSGLSRIQTRLGKEFKNKKLATYQSQSSDSLITSLLVAFCIAYALIAGYFLGVFQQRILQQFALPIGALLMIFFWALPDRQGASYKALTVSFFLAMVASAAWPAYLAIALPGLPWITVTRLIYTILALSFFYLIATDKQSRTLIASQLASQATIKIFLILFILTQFLTIPLARSNASDALSAVINYQMIWTLPLFAALIVFHNTDNFNKLCKTILWTTVILCIIGLLEYRREQVLWANSIPSFLKVVDPMVERILAGVRRAADGLYRVNATFTTSLSLAEYLGLALPFIIHQFFINKTPLVRLAITVLYIATIATIIVTRSRLGMIAVGITHLIYPLLVGLRRWSHKRNDLIGPSLIALYPIMLLTFMAALLASRRLYIMFLGSGAHQASNDARETMYEKGIPMILKNPWGFGANQGAGALGFYSPTGILTIDSYYLSIGLDYGIIGLITFYGMIIIAITLCVRTYLASNDQSTSAAAPIAIALTSYFIIKSVLSQSQNQNLLFVFIGAAIALNAHSQSTLKQQKQYNHDLS